jgi:hypothetical protein
LQTHRAVLCFRFLQHLPNISVLKTNFLLLN